MQKCQAIENNFIKMSFYINKCSNDFLALLLHHVLRILCKNKYYQNYKKKFLFLEKTILNAKQLCGLH